MPSPCFSFPSEHETKLKYFPSGNFPTKRGEAARANLWAASVCDEVFIPRHWIRLNLQPGRVGMRMEWGRMGCRLHLFAVERRASLTKGTTLIVKSSTQTKNSRNQHHRRVQKRNAGFMKTCIHLEPRHEALFSAFSRLGRLLILRSNLRSLPSKPLGGELVLFFLQPDLVNFVIFPSCSLIQ